MAFEGPPATVRENDFLARGRAEVRSDTGRRTLTSRQHRSVPVLPPPTVKPQTCPRCHPWNVPGLLLRWRLCPGQGLCLPVLTSGAHVKVRGLRSHTARERQGQVSPCPALLSCTLQAVLTLGFTVPIPRQVPSQGTRRQGKRSDNKHPI